MHDIILHHYPISPFSEKIRLILGYKKLTWKSVIIPTIMPKPDVTALTGGYRRTPFMQIGADIYCDSALIADVLERLAPEPSLYPQENEGLARMLAQWADATLFWTAVAYVFQPAAIPYLLGNVTPEQAKAFSIDRASMRGNAPRMSAAEATGALTEYLHRMGNMLADGKPFLLGRQPTIADFSVYHCLWFVQRAEPLAGILDIAPGVGEWMARMAAFGHHQSEALASEQAIAIARTSEPATGQDRAFHDTHGVSPGQRVTITPTDYALDPVEGDLVLSTLSEFAIRREDPRAGEVVVHFPRIGFQLKKA